MWINLCGLPFLFLLEGGGAGSVAVPGSGLVFEEAAPSADGEKVEGKHWSNGGGRREGVPGGGLNSQADPPSFSEGGSDLNECDVVKLLEGALAGA